MYRKNLLYGLAALGRVSSGSWLVIVWTPSTVVLYREEVDLELHPACTAK